jgi:hypothetical protein
MEEQINLMIAEKVRLGVVNTIEILVPCQKTGVSCPSPRHFQHLHMHEQFQ